MYLKISPMKDVVKFGKNGKLSPRYVGPYEVLQRFKKVEYELRTYSIFLPNELSSVYPVYMFPCLRSACVIPYSFLLLKG